MTLATQQMVADTVMKFGHLVAALDAISILDWDNIKQIVARNDAWPRCPEWNALFVAQGADHPPQYGAWFEDNFGEFPKELHRQALQRVCFQLRHVPANQNGSRWFGKTIRDLLIAGYYVEDLKVYFRPAVDVGMAEELEIGRLRLRLYDRSTHTWVWRNGLFKSLPTYDYQQDDGEEIFLVPTNRAKITIASKGCSITMYNEDKLAAEPVIDILPFENLEMPTSYFQRPTSSAQ